MNMCIAKRDCLYVKATPSAQYSCRKNYGKRIKQKFMIKIKKIELYN
jgi:hypothetical protein